MNIATSLHPLLTMKSTLTLMFAPPGWGKTTLILDIYKEFPGKIVFISPLRALSEEFFSRASPLGNVYLSSKEGACDSFLKRSKSLLVTTAEKLNEEVISIGESQDILYIFDEFHLFYYWGDDFRPLLKERLMNCANYSCQILGLTATMDESLIDLCKAEFLIAIDHFYILNLGNQVLLNKPKDIYNFSKLNKSIFNRFLLREIHSRNHKGTILVFCRFRGEVFQWLDFCNRQKIDALGCVGGKVDLFLESLSQNSRPRVIFSTSALSHGVNLPTITKVFLSYPINNRDFWIQMVGRGGRDGSNYEVYEMEKSSLSFWNLYQSMIIWLRDLFLSLNSGTL